MNEPRRPPAPPTLPYAAPPPRPPVKPVNLTRAGVIATLLFGLPVAAAMTATVGMLFLPPFVLGGILFVLIGGGLGVGLALVCTRPREAARPVGQTAPPPESAPDNSPPADPVLAYATPLPDPPPPTWLTVVDRLVLGVIGGVLLVIGGLGVLWWLIGPRKNLAIAPQGLVLLVGLMAGGVFAVWLGLRRR